MDSVYIVNYLILYSHRSTEKGVNSYSLRVIRGCILNDDANIQR